MVIGFAITEHCNLRCPHCIRDDVTTYRALGVPLIERVIDDATTLFGPITVSLTGGEPLIHERFADIVDLCRERGLPYRFVTNGWAHPANDSIVRPLPAAGGPREPERRRSVSA